MTISGVRLKTVAVPVEHGGWSLLLQPIVLGLFLAPSIAGIFLALAALGAFLGRHPFKMVASDRLRRRQSSRTPFAMRFVILYVGSAIIFIALALNTAGTALLLPLVIATPFAVLQLYFDSTRRSRALIPELAGAISTGAMATAIALSGGWPRSMAFVLWLILTAQTIPTIIYVRARLALLHGRSPSKSVVIAAHLLAMFVVMVLSSAKVAPFLAVVAVVMLLIRALIGFSRSDRNATAKQLGLGELAFGSVTIILIAVGYALGW